MIVQEFTLHHYDYWHVKVFYAVTSYWTGRILHELERIGCPPRELQMARRNLESGNLNTGLTYSDLERRETVMVIALTSSAGEFQNSLDHEKGHLCRHITRAFGIDPFGEEEQYLSGEIGQKMFPVAYRFLCPNCRKQLNRKPPCT